MPSAFDQHVEHAPATYHRTRRKRIVDDDGEGRRGMRHPGTHPSDRPRGGQYEQHDDRGAQYEQQKIPQLQSLAVLAFGGDEISDRRKQDRRREPPPNQVEEDRDRRGSQAQQGERLEESDHPSRGRRAVARRSTYPNGVSVNT